jgi:lactate permease
MLWTQAINPLNNMTLSVIVAVLPVIFIFWALMIKKMKGYLASMIAAGIAICIAVAAYGMPVKLALLSAVHGMIYGLFPICWIVLSAVFLFNLTVKSGQFEIIRQFMSSITSDRRLQALLIAFSFGAFLEGTSGFGTPVAITAAMLVGLGFQPLYAAGVCLIANTAPVAFGSVGIPIFVAAQVTGIPDLAISQMVGRTLPVLSVILPFYLVVLMAGYQSAKEVLPAALVSGISFAFFQWLSSNYFGPMLPDIIAGILSIMCLLIFLKFWKPRSVWRFPDEPPVTAANIDVPRAADVWRAWSPFIILTVVIFCWGISGIKHVFDNMVSLQFEIPFLHNAISDVNNRPLPQIFRLNLLSAAGTAIFITSLVSIPLTGLSFSKAAKIFAQTVNQLKFPFVSIASVLAFAYVVNNSGISITIAHALAETGLLFPLFCPVLGWLGVFITGSDTSSNALFGKLQTTTATSIGMDPLVAIAANTSGGVVGKMISPQSIAVAAAAGHLVGKESNLFRFTVKHSFIMLAIISVITAAQVYILPSIIPEYPNRSVARNLINAERSDLIFYIAAAAVMGIIIVFVVRILVRMKMNKKIKVNDKVY